MARDGSLCRGLSQIPTVPRAHHALVRHRTVSGNALRRPVPHSRAWRQHVDSPRTTNPFHSQEARGDVMSASARPRVPEQILTRTAVLRLRSTRSDESALTAAASCDNIYSRSHPIKIVMRAIVTTSQRIIETAPLGIATQRASNSLARAAPTTNPVSANSMRDNSPRSPLAQLHPAAFRAAASHCGIPAV